jgi:hypothetical protein
MNGITKTTKKMPFNMQVYNMQAFIKDYGYDPEEIDLVQLMDRNESFDSNRKLIAQKLRIPINPMGGGLKVGSEKRFMSQPVKKAKKELDMADCDYLAEQCEITCNNNACKTYRKNKCPGEVTKCTGPRKYIQSARKKVAPLYGSCQVGGYTVQAHTRPPQHNSRTGQQITVSGYEVQPHGRLCRRSGNG